MRQVLVVITCVATLWLAAVDGYTPFSKEDFVNVLIDDERAPQDGQGDIIDLDDGTVAIGDGWGLTGEKHKMESASDDADTDDTPEPDTPLSNIFSLDTSDHEDPDNVTFVDDEDEDMGSGSGSGAGIEIEEVEESASYNATEAEVGGNPEAENSTTEYYSAGDDGIPDEQQNAVTETPDDTETSSGEKPTSPTPAHAGEEDLPPYCEELTNVTWAPWSPWLRSGDSDIRFRRCQSFHAYTSSEEACEGPYFEVRPCSPRSVKACRTHTGDVTEEYDVTCSGIDLRDIQHIDEIESPLDAVDTCEYTLYDLKYNMVIGEPLTTDGLLMSADAGMWCFSREKFVPFYTPTEHCRKNLQAFCKSNAKCVYEKNRKKQLKHKGDLRKTCWEEFVLGGVLPEGLPDPGGNQMICQKFDKYGMFGRALGHKQEYYATLYDTFRRIPVFSLAVVRELGDDKWPDVDYMVERALVPEDISALSWFFKDKKRGITRLADLQMKSCESKRCTYGERQALPEDYDHSGYRLAPLLSPDAIGGDLGARLSTFTMTNTAPIQPSVYPSWKRALALTRNFALTECKLPIGKKHQNGTKSRSESYDFPEMYLVSGVVPSIRHEEVIGNDVNVPSLFWLAACCMHGADVASFGVYAYNQYGQTARAVTVQNLQLLLQSSFYDTMDVSTIKLFPAFESICSSPEYDISYKIEL